MTISKILIANRGEIACRVIRTANRLGVKCVAVYSDADANSLHVKQADEAIYIGPPQAQKSYLVKENIIKVAKQTKCQAIHPGYGFLSESFEFSELCAKNDLIFIGAPWKAIRDMGIKSTSKFIMSAAKVPIIEGYHEEDQSEERLLKEAHRIGFPIMIKAVRGGGGKGMRIAFKPEEFTQQLHSAKTEALKSFNNDEMLIEKFVERPRHVEVQVFGDHHGNYVYLYERDCSVQRRHQKIIEEAPAPGLTDETRRRIGEAAVKAARAVDYVGAGTVEFIVDPQQNFYFMEMNTRLQVEHPITEMITNTDLVEWQIRVAQGEKLPLSQDQVQYNGHAFEARIYAEDPSNNFMPGAGKLKYLSTPDTSQPNSFIRVETGVEHGDEVSVHYDPLIAKLVVWSKDRKAALNKLKYALGHYHIGGITTNIPFLMSLSDHKEFIAGNVHTDFIPQHRQELFAKKNVIDENVICSSICSILNFENDSYQQLDPFMNKINQTFWTNVPKQRKLGVSFDNNKTVHHVELSYTDKNNVNVFDLQHNNKTYHIKLMKLNAEKREYQIEINGHRTKFTYFKDPDSNKFFCFINDNVYEFNADEPVFMKALLGEGGAHAHADSLEYFAPMPGIVDKINVKLGEKVKKGDPLVVMIAMKMEYVIRASRSGIVKTISCQTGANVNKGVKLVTLDKLDEQ